MADPLIAIVGSYTPERDYEPPLLRSFDEAKQAAEELGRELAKAGYRIMVYSSDPAFIEADVVRGYVSSGLAKPQSIHIRYPQVVTGNSPPAFAEQATQASLFDPAPDVYASWQVSFYKSLRAADGIILIAGAGSALITGLIAQMYSIPLISIATFGGSAQTVWAISTGDLAAEAERKLMNMPQWTDQAASRLVEALGTQRQRSQEEKTASYRAEQLREKVMRNRAIAAGLFLLVALVLTGLGTFWASPKPLLFAVFFLGTPLFAGAVGGMGRNLFDSYRGITYQLSHRSATVIFLGMLAGVVAALLFVVAQWASNPEIKNLGTAVPQGLNLLVPFEFIIGAIAGLTLESVFAKLIRTDVVNVDPVAAKTV